MAEPTTAQYAELLRAYQKDPASPMQFMGPRAAARAYEKTGENIPLALAQKLRELEIRDLRHQDMMLNMQR